ncbi:MAG: hypothetical protein IJR41_03490, partial [Atopobiaceae bacterium]|nr:hypothetical protein [Atopobiaceae bacterium]
DGQRRHELLDGSDQIHGPMVTHPKETKGTVLFVSFVQFHDCKIEQGNYNSIYIESDLSKGQSWISS